MIYLDNNSTTQLSSRVVEAMIPYLTACYFNPSASTTALTGADKPRQAAAQAMASLFNAEEPDCFVFTSGATESNNWVFANFLHGKQRGRILISAIEHASVSEPAQALKNYGFEVVDIPVDGDGLIVTEALVEALNDETLFVSIMAANNETGVLQEIEVVGNLIREHAPQALFHTDATQAVGKIPVDLSEAWTEIDLLSFSAHKFHGPKGVGGLYIRPGVNLHPLLRGGGQQRGYRAGTINTAGLAGLKAAIAEINLVDMEGVRSQRDEFEKKLAEEFPNVAFHSRNALRLPNTSTFSLPGTVGEEIAQLLATQGIIVGTGSACSSGALHPPKTVLALGTPYALAEGTLRISIAVNTDPSFADTLIAALKQPVNGLYQ